MLKIGPFGLITDTLRPNAPPRRLGDMGFISNTLNPMETPKKLDRFGFIKDPLKPMDPPMGKITLGIKDYYTDLYKLKK